MSEQNSKDHPIYSKRVERTCNNCGFEDTCLQDVIHYGTHCYGHRYKEIGEDVE